MKKLNRKQKFKKQLFWESCIKFIQEDDNSLETNISGVCFYLNQDILNRIIQAKKNKQNLVVSPIFLSHLREYALLAKEGILQSGLTFCTSYQEEDWTEILIRSVISFDGNIIHLVCHDCLSKPEFFQQITSAHYWLIEQLINQLHPPKNKWLNLFSWEISLGIIIVFISFNFSWLFPLNVLKIIVLLLIFLGLRWLIKSLLSWWNSFKVF